VNTLRKEKAFYVFILLLSIGYRAISQEKIDTNLFLYVPTIEETTNYLNFYKYLNNFDNNKIQINDEKLKQLYVMYSGKDNISSLLFESYLRFTSNNEVRQRILGIITNNKLNDSFSLSLVRLYNSSVEDVNGKNQQDKRFNYNDVYYDEHINQFTQDEIGLFDKHLGIMLNRNSWGFLEYQNTKDDSKIEDKNNVMAIYGGGTNSMNISFKRIPNISKEDFKIKEIDASIGKKGYQNWKIIELSNEGILHNSGTDLFVIGFGYGPDIFSPIESGRFEGYLYNSKQNTGYTVDYYMNISPKNNNYENRYRLWNKLLFQLLFSYIEE
jgi:hypothetical protein